MNPKTRFLQLEVGHAAGPALAVENPSFKFKVAAFTGLRQLSDEIAPSRSPIFLQPTVFFYTTFTITNGSEIRPQAPAPPAPQRALRCPGL